MTTDKRPLLLFSGGLDSTYHLWWFIASGTDVDVVYIGGDQHPSKVDKEKEAVKNILIWLADLRVKNPGFGRVVEVHEVNMQITSIGSNGNPGFSQVPLWIFGLSRVVKPWEHSEIILSYVQGDQYCAMVPHLQEAWKHYFKCTINSLDQHEFVPIKAPLAVDHTKSSILSVLPEELLKLVWWCEIPITKGKKTTKIFPCKKCVACERMQKELFFFNREKRISQKDPALKNK